MDEAEVILNDSSLTFIFSVRNMQLRNEIGVHWTMKCGNDIIEGAALLSFTVNSSGSGGDSWGSGGGVIVPGAVINPAGHSQPASSVSEPSAAIYFSQLASSAYSRGHAVSGGLLRSPFAPGSLAGG